MIFVTIGIFILAISFVIALFSLVREQKHVSRGLEEHGAESKEEEITGPPTKEEIPQGAIESQEAKVRDSFEEHAKLRASHLETMFAKDEPVPTTAEYEPFYWEQSRAGMLGGSKEDEGDKPQESRISDISADQKLAGEFSIKDAVEKT